MKLNMRADPWKCTRGSDRPVTEEEDRMALKRSDFPRMTRKAFKEKRNTQKVKDSRNAKKAAKKEAAKPRPGF